MENLGFLLRTAVLAMAGALACWSQGTGVAILDSQFTKEFFRRHYAPCNPAQGSFFLGAEEYQRYFRGWEYVVQQELGITPVIIQDQDVNAQTLAKFRLLILSNTASLSQAQSEAIHHATLRGLRLLATFGAGYKDIVFDARQIDQLKLEKGGTFGLHQLWHDPMTKLFSSEPFDLGVDVRITRYEGPTACLNGLLTGNVVHYGALGNMLAQRPENHHDVLGFLVIDNWTRPAPAIINSRIGHGRVVYLAFAPEYIVSKEFNLPVSPACPDGQNWIGRSLEGRLLMRCAINFLLNN